MLRPVAPPRAPPPLACAEPSVRLRVCTFGGEGACSGGAGERSRLLGEVGRRIGAHFGDGEEGRRAGEHDAALRRARRQLGAGERRARGVGVGDPWPVRARLDVEAAAQLAAERPRADDVEVVVGAAKHADRVVVQNCELVVGPAFYS